MKRMKRKRERMICDLPPEFQLAIRLRALRLGVSTSVVVEKAMWAVYPQDCKEAEEIIIAREPEPPKGT